ncbi:MFS transporter [Saccharothrix sp. Mg75]|uniref:MFS transporter n=1 Tax=Saccharothrix sp. Mg75 TaxID=3445357 RepID=UPI003EED45A4
MIPPLPTLVTARVIGQFGDRFTLLALPMFAISEAGATPAEAALLFTAYALPGVAAALLGPYFDRSDRLRSWCTTADLARGALLLALVVLAPNAGSHAGWVLVLLLTFACGCWAVVFDVGLQGYLPRAIPADQLPAANGWFARVQAVADVAGPPAAGAVVGLAGANVAIAVDAASFVVSGLLLLLLRERPAPVSTTRAATRLGEWTAGVRHLLAEPLLRSAVVVMLLLNFGGAMIGALWVVYATGPLMLDPATLGAITAVGGLSALAGSAVVSRLSDRFGPRNSLVFGFGTASVALFFIPAAALGIPVVLLAAFQVLFSASAVVVAVNAATVRQRCTPPDLQARVFAAIRSCQDVILPAGGAVAALVAAVATTQVAVLVGAVVAAAAIPAALRIARTGGAERGEVVRSSEEGRGGGG